VGKLHERVYRRRIHDVAQLKSRFMEEWERFNQVINLSSIKQSSVHVFRLAFEHVENILNTCLTFALDSHMSKRCQ